MTLQRLISNNPSFNSIYQVTEEMTQNMLGIKWDVEEDSL